MLQLYAARLRRKLTELVPYIILNYVGRLIDIYGIGVKDFHKLFGCGFVFEIEIQKIIGIDADFDTVFCARN